MSGCETTDLGESSGAPQPDVLRVGVTPNAPPFISESAGTMVGLEADFAHSVAAHLGRTVRFVEMPFEKLIPALGAGKIDVIMSGLTVSVTREPLLMFTDPYMISGQGVLTRSEKAGYYQYPEVVFSVADTIGVEAGSIADVLVQRRCSQSKRLTYASPEQGAKALMGKKINVFIGDLPVVWRLAAEHQGDGLVAIPKRLTSENIAWAVRRGDSVLQSQLNGILAEWKTDGTLHKMISRHMPRYELLPRL